LLTMLVIYNFEVSRLINFFSASSFFYFIGLQENKLHSID